MLFKLSYIFISYFVVEFYNMCCSCLLKKTKGFQRLNGLVLFVKSDLTMACFNAKGTISSLKKPFSVIKSSHLADQIS